MDARSRNPLAAGVVLLLSVSGCGLAPCTEIGCENTVEVAFGSRIDGPYDLGIQSDTGLVTARCNPEQDPTQPDAPPNPPELECHPFGFRITGGELALVHDMVVTIYDLEHDALLVDRELVSLTREAEHHPNGPDCPPTCVDWVGSLDW